MKNKSLKQPPPSCWTLPCHIGTRIQTPTSAMVDATSASMATGCPNKPRKAVQKEGKVSSNNVLDSQEKMRSADIFHVIFWLQMIYSCLRKPKKKFPKKRPGLQSRNFSGAKSYQTLRIFSKMGISPDAVFSYVRAHNSRS